MDCRCGAREAVVAMLGAHMEARGGEPGVRTENGELSGGAEAEAAAIYGTKNLHERSSWSERLGRVSAAAICLINGERQRVHGY